MNTIFRTLIAGYGAKKLGGGCFSTIIIFLLIFWALGMCGSAYAPAEAYESAEPTVETIETTPAAQPAVALVPAG